MVWLGVRPGVVGDVGGLRGVWLGGHFILAVVTVVTVVNRAWVFQKYLCSIMSGRRVEEMTLGGLR